MQCTPQEIEEKRRRAQLKLSQKNANRNSPNQTNFAGVNNQTNRSGLTNPGRTNNSFKSTNLFNNKPNDKPQPSTSFYGQNKVISGVCSLISEDRFKVELSAFSQPAIDIFKTMPTRIYSKFICSSFIWDVQLLPVDHQTKLSSFHINDYLLLQNKLKSLRPDVTVGQLPNYVLNCCKASKPDYSKIDLSTIDQELAGTLMPFQEEGVW